MTNNNRDDAFASLANMDPDLVTALKEQTALHKARTQTSSERAKAKADAARSKATYDLPAPVKTAIESIAQAEGVSKSNLVAEFLTLAINAYRQGKINLTPQKQPARAVRWDWEIRVTEVEG